MELSSHLQDFIADRDWTNAKTMPQWPHEYIVRDKVNEDLFVELVNQIRTFGYEGKFYNKSIIYFDYKRMTYWTMGAPVNDTVIINRCLKENTYEERLKRNQLP